MKLGRLTEFKPNDDKSATALAVERAFSEAMKKNRLISAAEELCEKLGLKARFVYLESVEFCSEQIFVSFLEHAVKITTRWKVSLNPPNIELGGYEDRLIEVPYTMIISLLSKALKKLGLRVVLGSVGRSLCGYLELKKDIYFYGYFTVEMEEEKND